MARVVIAPDGFGGTLTAAEATAAIAEGWERVRPGDELMLVPMSDGGEGLLEVVAAPGDTRHLVEVAGPLGHPVEAVWLQRTDGSAVIESARACGLALVPPDQRNPLLATTYGVGQLVAAARDAGVRRMVVGLGGSATVDGGSGALLALGFRAVVEDGSGLKVGGEDLHRVTRITREWVIDVPDLEVEALADVITPLPEAARRFGPQKGADPAMVEQLTVGLERWAEVVERDLVAGGDPDAGSPGPPLRERPGTGAAGGLGFALAAALRASLRPGSETVATLVGLPEALDRADVVVTGEGRLDATTSAGKVVAHVALLAAARGMPVRAVVGQQAPGAPRLEDVEAAAPDGPSDDPAGDLRAAAARSAARWRP